MAGVPLAVARIRRVQSEYIKSKASHTADGALWHLEASKPVPRRLDTIDGAPGTVLAYPSTTHIAAVASLLSTNVKAFGGMHGAALNSDTDRISMRLSP